MRVRLRDILSKIFCIAVLSMLSLGSLSAQNDKISQQRSLIASLEKQVAAGEREIASLRESRAAIEVRVSSLVSQIEARNRLLTARRREVSTLRSEISKADANTARLSKEIDTERTHYAKMVREAYRNYSSNNTLTYLFSATDFQDVARRISNLRAVAELRESRIKRIDSLSNRLSKERAVLLSRKSELDKAVKELTLQTSRLQDDVNAARRNISSMSAKERKALQERELQQSKLSAAVKELQKLIKGNQEGASFTSKTSNLNLPVVGGRVKQYMDNMAEIIGAEGANIISIYEGKVVDVRSNRITGKYDVYIAHGEYITSYAGLSSVTVAKNQSVARSEIIGVIGEAIDIITMQGEYKIVFGIYPPTTKETMSAANCFKR